MNQLYAPKLTDYIVICENIDGTSLKLPYSWSNKIHLRHKGSKENHSVDWPLRPGEWYEMSRIYYCNKSDATLGYSGLVGLQLARSHKDRKWVKEKMRLLSTKHLSTQDFSCYDRVVYYLFSQLNHKAIIVPTLNAALKLRREILEDNDEHPDAKRWNMILQATE